MKTNAEVIKELQQEQVDLNGKIYRLGEFKSKGLVSEKHAQLLDKQFKVMSDYSFILSQRMENLRED